MAFIPAFTWPVLFLVGVVGGVTGMAVISSKDDKAAKETMKKEGITRRDGPVEELLPHFQDRPPSTTLSTMYGSNPTGIPTTQHPLYDGLTQEELTQLLAENTPTGLTITRSGVEINTTAGFFLPIPADINEKAGMTAYLQSMCAERGGCEENTFWPSGYIPEIVTDGNPTNTEAVVRIHDARGAGHAGNETDGGRGEKVTRTELHELYAHAALEKTAYGGAVFETTSLSLSETTAQMITLPVTLQAPTGDGRVVDLPGRYIVANERTITAENHQIMQTHLASVAKGEALDVKAVDWILRLSEVDVD